MHVKKSGDVTVVGGKAAIVLIHRKNGRKLQYPFMDAAIISFPMHKKDNREGLIGYEK